VSVEIAPWYQHGLRFTCTRCGNVAKCEGFVCRDAAPDTEDSVPDYCLNGLFFSVLKPD